ncbi:MAG: hypothetical protein IPJ88_11225 [Myxococcales bacterium]|nr:MAG: hypothetical protein IPJ88_11225 [Myxococcales bacterium]
MKQKAIALVALCVSLFGIAALVLAKDTEKASVSVLIYPPSHRGIKVNHDHREHKKLRCMRCHEASKSRIQAYDAPLAKAENCLPCHKEQLTSAHAKLREKPSPIVSGEQQATCGYCHRLQSVSAGKSVASGAPARARLKFSHKVHAKNKASCLSCHRSIGPKQSMPSMRSCFACHGKSNSAAKATCTTCHLSLSDGRMKSRFKEGWLNPPRWLGGMHHDLDFMVSHRWIAADNASRCGNCHKEKDCVDCHDGKVRPWRIHPNDFLSTHGQLARRKSDRCTSCHASQSFCMACHARLGIASTSAPNTRAPGRFHPPAAVWVRGPSRHAIEAQRSLSSCISCHSEQDCVSCHGGLGLGAGISPHPPGFSANCQKFLGTNDRACRRCHMDLSGLCM